MAKNLKKQKIKKIPLNILVAFFLFVAAIAALKSENNKARLRTLGMQTQIGADHKTIYQWEQTLQEKPDYRDGWVQLSAAHYKVGNKEKAKEALQKAIAIDPNNEALLSFKKIVEN